VTTHSINITINLNALRGELQRALQRIIYLVAAGLQTKQYINGKQLELPTNSINMIFDSSLLWDDQKAQNEYMQWVLSNGFRDAIESLNSFLESTHRVLSFWKLAGIQKDGAEITGAHWNDIVVGGAQKFHSLGFPDKLEHIRNKHSIPYDESLSSHVLSINKARNCFVHRCGIVSGKDLNNGNSLQIKYRRMVFLVRNVDGEKELVIGEVVQKDSVIAVRNQDETKSFALGSKIELTVKEFTDITWCLFLFGDNLVQKVSAYGLQHGFVAESKSDKAQHPAARDAR